MVVRQTASLMAGTQETISPGSQLPQERWPLAISRRSKSNWPGPGGTEAISAPSTISASPVALSTEPCILQQAGFQQVLDLGTQGDWQKLSRKS